MVRTPVPGSGRRTWGVKLPEEPIDGLTRRQPALSLGVVYAVEEDLAAPVSDSADQHLGRTLGILGEVGDGPRDRLILAEPGRGVGRLFGDENSTLDCEAPGGVKEKGRYA